MKFPNNIMGKVFVSTGCKRDYTMRTVIYGTKGTLICDNTSPTMTLFTVDENQVADLHTVGEAVKYMESLKN